MRRIADANGALLKGYVHNALGQRLFKTELQFPPAAGDEADPAFFASLLAEIGTGGAQSTGTSLYFYLPSPSGPMPIAAITNGTGYAVHTDHLNTPRRLTLANKTVAWQWAFSAFGDAQPTAAKNRFVDLTTSASLGSTNIADVTFNLRYPGQYFDKESGLHYNYFRSYDAKTGRYTQSDPIDLAGGWNKFAYVDGNPLMYSDPDGLRARPGPRTNGGNSRQRREAERAEANRVESYYQRRADQDAWVNSFTNRDQANLVNYFTEPAGNLINSITGQNRYPSVETSGPSVLNGPQFSTPESCRRY